MTIWLPGGFPPKRCGVNNNGHVCVRPLYVVSTGPTTKRYGCSNPACLRYSDQIKEGRS